MNREPKASFQAPSGISYKPLHYVMEIRAAFHPLVVTNILYQGSFIWLHDHGFGGIGSFTVTINSIRLSSKGKTEIYISKLTV